MNGVCALAVWMLSAAVPLTSAPAAQPEFATTVKLEINGQANVRQAIANIMVPKLRAIPGVQMVDANPQWTIRLETVVVPDANNQNVAGIGLSEVIIEHRPYTQMLQILAKSWDYLLASGVFKEDQTLDNGMKQLVAKIKSIPPAEDSARLAAHRMGIIHVNNLQKACADLVTDFNVTLLHPAQKTSQAGNTTEKLVTIRPAEKPAATEAPEKTAVVDVPEKPPVAEAPEKPAAEPAETEQAK